MDTREIDVLVQRLLANPHDSEALAYAHREGMRDPRSYAMVLEKVGTQTEDAAYASHWLTEAAQVWSTSLGDAHRTARLLMMALEKDPTFDLAAERLAQLYRDHGEKKALAALLERRVKALEPTVAHSEESRAHVAGLYEELGRLFSEPPLSNTKKAIERYLRAIKLDPQLLQAIYTARELCKNEQQWAEALPLFEAERAIISDDARKLALYRDEAVVRGLSGDRAGATLALRAARALDPNDAALAQELGTSLLERVQDGEAVSEDEQKEGVNAFVMLAETYDGEHGFAYATAALDLDAGHDRAMQLAAHWAGTLGREGDLGGRWAAYLEANPNGALVEEASRYASSADPILEPILEPVEDTEDQLLLADDIPGLIQAAQRAADGGSLDEALAAFKDVLALDPIQPDAFSWVEDHYRQKRDYEALRELLMQAARAPQSSREARKQHYREMAGLSETHLRDLDGAIHAYKQLCQLDRGDESARDQLRRLLERASRWDELALFLEQEAMGAPDVEARISLEKRLAQLHESKRNDLAAAGEAWARIAALIPDDESTILTAVELFVRASRLDLAAQTISENVSAIEDQAQRALLLERLGDLREKLNEHPGAGDAFRAAAKLRASRTTWRAAERCFAAAERWEEAAAAVSEQANLSEGLERAALLSREGELLVRAGEEARALSAFEQALELDPESETYAREVETRLEAGARIDDLVLSLLNRAGKMGEGAARVSLRKRAAALQLEKLGDEAGARESLLRVLDDGDDAEALATLSDLAEQHRDFDEAVSLLQRLAKLLSDPSSRIENALREAKLLSEGLADFEAAIARYEEILADLDPSHGPALEQVAKLYEQQGNHESLSRALEKMLAISEDDAERIELARRLAKLYEGPLADERRAMAALETVHRLDSEDFEAIARMYALSERAENWERAAALLAQLIEVEGDEEELSSMTRKLASLLADHLDRGDEALRALVELADAADVACREAYVKLGDRLGRSGEVARKLLDWHLAAPPSEARTTALSGAFDRFVATGNDADAVQVAMQLARSSDTAEMAQRLEEVAIRTKDLDALATAHERLCRGLSGEARALELLRQAEVLVVAGVDPVEAISHGELGLVSVAPEEAEPLLARLAKLTVSDEQVIELYERQVARCKQPESRLRAFFRAAEVAVERGAKERAKSFLGLALSGQLQDEALEALETTARDFDEERGETILQGMLAEALAAGGQGLRDGGRTRSMLLRRAAKMAEQRLSDTERALQWLGDALIAHVEPVTLEALSQLASRMGELSRVDQAIERALGEVFDGPLVRQLLAYRIELRRDRLEDLPGAMEDLKRLHDLAPADTAIAEELASLLTQLGDHRGMVQLLEDQILRGRDPHARAELARRVAGIWEVQLDEPREAADAWRRVLRMKPGDAEAQEGLERAKAAMLKKAPQDAGSPRLSSPAPLRRSVPPPRSSTRPPPPRSSRPSSGPSLRAGSLPPPPPVPQSQPMPEPLADASSVVSVADAELLVEEVHEKKVEMPPMPSFLPPPLPQSTGIAHSGPPKLPFAEPEADVLMVDDAELLDSEE